jgi:hypothetical protein
LSIGFLIAPALYYSKVTGKVPTVALMCKKSEQRFIDRLSKAAPHIELIVILNDK